MKPLVPAVIAVLSVVVACGGESPAPAKSLANVTATDAGPAESCHSLAKLICDGSGGASEACQSIRASIEFLPPSSCIEALKEPDFIRQRLSVQKESCQRLTERACQTMGEDSASCAMVRERTARFDSLHCQSMLARFDEVVSELRQFEKESLPLDAEAQKAIAAADAPAFGPLNARVTVVLFSDFECPYCAKAAAAANHLKVHYADKVRVVFRQFPLSFHEHARGAAEAALIAHASGKFWEFHDQLFDNQERLSPDALEGYARFVGLDPRQFRETLSSHTFDAKVKVDLGLGERVSVKGTPTMFINGKRAGNPTSTEAVVSEVEAALAESTK